MLTVNPAITYGVFERVKGILIAAQVAAGAEARLTPGRSFAIGVLSKTLATVVTYPYIFVSAAPQPGRHISSEVKLSCSSRRRSGFKQGHRQTPRRPKRKARLPELHTLRTQQILRHQPRSPMSSPLLNQLTNPVPTLSPKRTSKPMPRKRQRRHH